MSEEVAIPDINYTFTPLQQEEWFINWKRVRVFRGEGEIKSSIGVAWSLILSQVVSGRGEYVRLIKSKNVTGE